MTALLPADIHALIERLRYFNAWRRGAECLSKWNSAMICGVELMRETE